MTKFEHHSEREKKSVILFNLNSHLDLNVFFFHQVKAVLEHGIEEYNKDFPRLRITLYDV